MTLAFVLGETCVQQNSKYILVSYRLPIVERIALPIHEQLIDSLKGYIVPPTIGHRVSGQVYALSTICEPVRSGGKAIGW